MESRLTSAYTYFEELAESKEFLNFILNNITCCILILNKNMELQAFNSPLKNMFVNKRDEHLLFLRCGEAIGCSYQVEEKSRCGETSRCSSCNLRIDAMGAYTSRKPIFQKSLVRDFYKVDGSKENKHLLYSIKPFYFKSNYYLMVLVEVAKTKQVIQHKHTSLPSESYY